MYGNQYAYQGQGQNQFQSQAYGQQGPPIINMGFASQGQVNVDPQFNMNQQQQSQMSQQSGFGSMIQAPHQMSNMGVGVRGQGFNSNFSGLRQQPGYGPRAGGLNTVKGSIAAVVGLGGSADLRRSVSATPMNATTNRANVKLDFISPPDLESFEATFLSIAGGSSEITAMIARNVFVQSGLPDDVLARIWDIASVLKNPSLTFPEFALAMFLIKHRLSTGTDIPSVLPPVVRAAVIAATSRQSASTTIPSPLSGGVVRSASGIGGALRPAPAVPSPLQNRNPAPFTPSSGSGFGSSRSSLAALNGENGMGGNTSATWAVTPSEKIQYDSVFKTWDPNNSGYISG
ncbi:hypothetical protein BC830DRAFT_400014 [Chytriomyces sp. MP71]|nr:hypothetical protein BC830DRAFT_400014 [Chytriomyces sp. MP71]